MKRTLWLAVGALVLTSFPALAGSTALPGPQGGNTSAVANLAFTPVRPAAIGASQNDYNPGVGNLFYLTASSTYNVTGIVAGADGFVIRLCNVGSNAITFTHRDASSAAANRLNNALGNASGNVVVAANQCIDYTYDLTNTRWQMGSTGSPSGMVVATGDTMTGTLTFTTAAVSISAAGAIQVATTGTPILVTATAGSSTSEVYFRGIVSDKTTSGLTLWNQSTTNARQAPAVWGFTDGSSTEAGLTLVGGVTAANDSGAVAALVLQCARLTDFTTAAAAVATKPCFNFWNYATQLGTWTAAGMFKPLTYGTMTDCADGAGAAACVAAPAGGVVVDDGATTVVVSTTAVTANSSITPVFDSSLGTKLGVTCNTTYVTPYVTARTAATSFTITISSDPAGANPVCLSYTMTN